MYPELNILSQNMSHVDLRPSPPRQPTRLKVYVGGSITGKTFEECCDYFKGLAARVRACGYDAYHPMIGKAPLKDSIDNSDVLPGHGFDVPISRNSEIVMRDRWMVKNADIILMDFTDATQVSIGSCFEMAWANLLQKQLIVVMQKGNLHDHCFVTESAIVFQTLDEAMCYLARLSTGAIN